MADSPIPAASHLSGHLVEAAQAWLAQDPDPFTARELASLLDAARSGDNEAIAELTDAFDGSLQFGTAGLRGKLGPGSNRMNRVVVARAAAGLARYLRGHHGPECLRVVIGYDARRNSDVFARDTARIMAGAGITAMVLPRALPTPVLAFAIRELLCAAGVMVTASHNPPDDNGYKVYLGDGSQIVAPVDVDIAECIAGIGPVGSIAEADDWLVLDEAVVDSYVRRALGLLQPGPRKLSVVYTAMHGVGGEVFMRVAGDAGFERPSTVAAQFDPDARFPTVSFPNPEEPGAMDLALADARARQADIIIANDPDADRCAVGIRTDNDYRMLSGDELGALIGWWIIERARRAGERLDGVYAQSIVSSDLLQRIAADAGLGYVATLTGFKWIARVPQLRFGYEEALGYCVDPDAVKDKDGITASLLTLELAAALKSEGRGPEDILDELAQRYGVYATSQLSVRVSNRTLISATMARLRAAPPTEIGGRLVLALDDLEKGCGGLPPTDGLRFLMRGARVIIRPSGTEPKLKCYLQIVVPVESEVHRARAAAHTAIAALRSAVADLLGL